MGSERLAGPPGVRWSVAIGDAESGDVITSCAPGEKLATASVGKVFLLLELAHRILRHGLDPLTRLDRRRVEAVADSGIWQHLATDELPIADLAVLVASVSDNLATNVLIDHLGLPAIQRWTDRLGLTDTRLLDVVRDARTPRHPPCLSTGTAAELVRLLHLLATDDLPELGTGPMVLGWLATGTDLSMTASAFGLDPLAHTDTDRGVRVVNKTGTDDGVRADVGVVFGTKRTLTYAVLDDWTPSSPDDPERDAVLAAMRHVGHIVRGMSNTQA